MKKILDIKKLYGQNCQSDCGDCGDCRPVGPNGEDLG